MRQKFNNAHKKLSMKIRNVRDLNMAVTTNMSGEISTG
jgi:hypothetical protein